MRHFQMMSILALLIVAACGGDHERDRTVVVQPPATVVQPPAAQSSPTVVVPGTKVCPPGYATC